MKSQQLLARVRRFLTPANRFTAQLLPDATDDDRRLVESVAPYTLTSPERRYALIESVRYTLRRALPGAFVECGVWRGGSALLMLKALQQAGVEDRDLWLYDTFEGMTAPSERDRSRDQGRALSTWEAAQASGQKAWNRIFNSDVFSFEQVRALLEGSGYPKHRLHFVRGPVEETLPAAAPEQIALLRLDTDWYESTRHELTCLYPHLVSGGVLIIDDYGHWDGCRAAVDEYFSGPDALPVLLNRIDYTGRMAVKP